MKKIITLILLGAVCAPITKALALTPLEADSVLFFKQEEKMARDVYQTLQAQWGVALFENISRSEQRHMDALDRLIARNQLVDSTPAQPGRFTIPKLQTLHDELVEMGGQSLENALAVGVLIEETDIADIQALLDWASDSQLRRVLTNLLRGSQNHLTAFSQALEQPEAILTRGTCVQGTSAPARKRNHAGRNPVR